MLADTDFTRQGSFSGMIVQPVVGFSCLPKTNSMYPYEGSS